MVWIPILLTVAAVACVGYDLGARALASRQRRAEAAAIEDRLVSRRIAKRLGELDAGPASKVVAGSRRSLPILAVRVPASRPTAGEAGRTGRSFMDRRPLVLAGILVCAAILAFGTGVRPALLTLQTASVAQGGVLTAMASPHAAEAPAPVPRAGSAAGSTAAVAPSPAAVPPGPAAVAPSPAAVPLAPVMVTWAASARSNERQRESKAGSGVAASTAPPSNGTGGSAGKSSSGTAAALHNTDACGQGACRSYVVRSGDTLLRIAARTHKSMQQLLAANPQLRDPNMIVTGERLWVPLG